MHDDTLRIHAETRADAALTAILQRLCAQLNDNEVGVIAGDDPECLHDFRVAVRRTRSALGQIKKTLPASIVADYRRRFTWLAGISGPTRDLDVYLLHFDAFRDRLPVELRTALEPLRTHLAARRADEQRKLAQTLRSPRYRQLKQGWQRSLSMPARRSKTVRPVKQIADARIWKLYRRAVKQGAALTAASPAAALHEVRKTCKKLRYLMQFFRDLYPQAALRALLKPLEALQDVLGAHQDLHVQEAALGDFKQEMATEGVLSPQTAAAVDQLRSLLHLEQQRQRERFMGRFRKFSRPKQRRYRHLFKNDAD